jgi:predicted dehydrogenase
VISSDRLRIALVGLGAWGTRAHLPACLACDDMHVVGLVDPNAEAVEKVGETYGIAGRYTSLDALFSAVDDLDALVIATPDDTHYDLVMQAFERGLHVLCEKPLGYNVEQAEAMAEAAIKHNRVAKMGFIFRYSPVVQRMKELIDAGYIGELQMYENATVNAQFVDPQTPRHWKMTKEHAGGGVFVEYGVHSMDLAMWFGGPISSVVANAMTLVPERPDRAGNRVPVEVDDVCSWIATYANGGEALFRTGWASLPVGGGGTRIYGSKGSLAWEMDAATRRSERLLGVTLDQREPQVLFEFKPPFDPRTDSGVFPLGLLARYDQRLINSFAQDIRAGKVTSGSFAEGLAAQRVVEAVRTSLDERRWVDVRW